MCVIGQQVFLSTSKPVRIRPRAQPTSDTASPHRGSRGLSVFWEDEL